MTQFVTEKHRKQAIEGLKRVVAFPSYLQDEVTGAPFGQDILDCLKDTLELFSEEGFETFIDPKGYYGFAEIGQGEEVFGVLCHLDVVPAGDPSLWDTPPFTATVVGDQAIVGRGVQDDKGPTIAALYAVKSLLDAGVTLTKRIRFIFGTDEENYWRCMDAYHKEQSGIDLGIAPDANFPVIYAEKGLLQVFLTGEGSDCCQVSGGTALNVVPDQAVYSGANLDQLAERLNQLGYSYEIKDKQQLMVNGKAIHSKDAPLGVNAITHLAEAMGAFCQVPVIRFLAELVKNDAHGTNVVGALEDEASGKLTFNCATLEVNATETKLGIDIRMPVTIEKDQVMKKIKAAAEQYGLTCTENDYIASLYVPVESELVQTLLEVYREQTGDMRPPQISGGATFARTMKNCVAFGAMFEKTVDTMHQVNETWQLDEMYRTMEIYAQAIYRLCGEKNK